MLIPGLPTGLSDVDFVTNGLHPGDLFVIAGAPGSGKTSFALTVAQHISMDYQKVVAFFSLEATEEAIISRVLCSEGRVDSNRVAKGYLMHEEKQRLEYASSRLAEARLYIDDSSSSLAAIKNKAEDLQDEVGLDLIVVDYIQLISSENQPYGYRLSRELKWLAKDLSVPVIVVSQLQRPEKRLDRRPQVSDLGNDVSLAQDADTVILIYREEMYNRTEENAGFADMFISKHRNGPTASFQLAYLKEFGRFENIWREGLNTEKSEAEKSKSVRNYVPIEDSKELLFSLVRHSQDHLIRLTANKIIAEVDCTLNIFKSPQEEEFYKAIVEGFPGCMVYPNVALSCLFEFDKLKKQLTREERRFFFRSTIDCVVFDEDHCPMLFFELDSSYHDTDEQQARDTYKDHIFSRAGRKLYRVRRIAPNLGQKEFEKLIKEILGKNDNLLSST